MPEPVKPSRWGATKTTAEVPKPAPKAETPKIESPKAPGFEEYPKLVYRQQEARSVRNAVEEKQAASEGFGTFSPK